VPGALLAAASFFAKDVYQERLSDEIAEMQHRIDIASTPDESPLSVGADETMKHRCETEWNANRLRPRVDFDKLDDVLTECGDGLKEMAQSARTIVGGSETLRSSIELSAQDSRTSVDLETRVLQALSDGASRLDRCKQTIVHIMYWEASTAGKRARGVSCDLNQPMMGYLATQRGYEAAIAERNLFLKAAEVNVAKKKRFGDFVSLTVIWLFVIGWAAHFAGSLFGIKVEGGE
jgi:hypothetical protein